jgi:hypothetical protein
MTPEQFFSEVVRASPSFETVRADHLVFYGEFLGHVLIADLWRFLASHYSGELVEGAKAPSEREIQEVFRLVERGLLEGDGDTENMIAVSFIEGCEGEDWYGNLAPYFGDAMKAELLRQEAWSKEHAYESDGPAR